MILPNRAASYVSGATGISNAPLKDHSFLVGAGSVYPTARDLHLLRQAAVTGRLGDGIRGSTVRNGRIDWNGSSNGFRAFADWDSITGAEIVFTGNVHTGAPDLLRKAVARIVAGDKVAPAAPPRPAIVELSDQVLRGYEGVYQLGNGTRLEVRARNGHLLANDWATAPVSETRFFSLRDYGEVTVVLGTGGKVERLDWKVAGDTLPAPRVGDLSDGAGP